MSFIISKTFRFPPNPASASATIGTTQSMLSSPLSQCISLVLRSALLILSTNLGALYETCSPFASFVGFDRDFQNLEKKYSKALLKTIKDYWSDENQNKLKLQREVINSTYSWDKRSVEWKNFFDDIRNLKS